MIGGAGSLIYYSNPRNFRSCHSIWLLPPERLRSLLKQKVKAHTKGPGQIGWYGENYQIDASESNGGKLDDSYDKPSNTVFFRGDATMDQCLEMNCLRKMALLAVRNMSGLNSTMRKHPSHLSWVRGFYPLNHPATVSMAPAARQNERSDFQIEQMSLCSVQEGSGVLEMGYQVSLGPASSCIASSQHRLQVLPAAEHVPVWRQSLPQYVAPGRHKFVSLCCILKITH